MLEKKTTELAYRALHSPDNIIALAFSRVSVIFRDAFRGFIFKEKSTHVFNYGTHLQEVKQEKLRVTRLAEQVLNEILFEPHREKLTFEQYTRIRESIKRFYLLVVPCLNPDDNEKIVEAEALTTRKHIGRDNDLEQTVWLAQENVAIGDRKFTRVPTSTLTENEKLHTERWLKANDGLIDHTFLAAEYIVSLIQAIQQSIVKLQESQQSSINDLQQRFLLIDPYLYGVKMLFHDLGRLINQDRLQHEIETQEILSSAGIHKDFREEPAYVALLNMEQTHSIYDMTDSEMDFMRFIFYVADFTAKVKNNGSIRRPSDFAEIITKQSMRYTGSVQNAGKSPIITDKEIFDQDDYGVLEGFWLTKILFWLRDTEKGLGFSISQFRRLYKQVEKKIPEIRSELGIQF